MYIAEDVLIKNHDFLVIDFSVNDKSIPFFQRTFEGLIRKILKNNINTAVLVLNNVYYDTGLNAEELHNIVADYYKIPHISMKEKIYSDIERGRYGFKEISEDGLHPNDRGHKMVAGFIIEYLENIYMETFKEGIFDKNIKEYTKLISPLTDALFESTLLLNNKNLTPKLSSFKTDTKEKLSVTDVYKRGWIGKSPGDRIEFEFSASTIVVQYRKSPQKPVHIARLFLDGEKEFILDGNFNEDWGDCLYLEMLTEGEMKKHSIIIEIMENKNKEAMEFYLNAFIVCRE